MAIFNLSSISATGIVAPVPDGDVGRINQLAVGTLASNTVIGKTTIDGLVTLVGGGDAAALHHHDAKYFTKTQLTSATPGSTGANLLSATAILGGSATTIQGIFSEIENEINALSSISMEWQKSVADKDLTAPPVTPALNSRYLIGLIPLSGAASGAWATHDAEIAQWNGSSWDFTVPETGMFVTADDEVLSGEVYFFNGTVWVTSGFESTTASGFLSTVGNDVRLTELDGGNVIIGDFSDNAVAVDTAVVGQIQADPVGGLTIKVGAIIDSYIDANAGISVSKLQPGNSADIIVCDGSGVPTLVAMSGDVTLSNAGVASIGIDVVDDTMIDFGTGAGQVNAADLPAAYTASNYTAANANVDGHLSGIDSEISTINSSKVSKSGDSMTGVLAMGTNQITGLADGTAADHAVNKDQLDALETSIGGDVSGKVSKSGDTMTGNLTMSSNKITSLANGSVAGDAVNFGQLSTKLDTSLKGAANGLAELDATGLVPASQLPSFVDDVLEYANFAALPVSGETGKIYVTLDNNKTFRWSGTVYIEISPNDVNSVNGQTGIVVLDTDDISEGAVNFYYTEGRFDTSFGAKDTDDLSEGAVNFYYTEGRFDTSLGTKDTDDISEGATNLYYTSGRFDTAFGTKSTTDLVEGTNLYYTTGRFDTAFGLKDSDDLSEGATNLYYTSGRFDTDFGTKTTTDLAEGTNLYFTTARAKTAAVADAINDGTTDVAPSQNAVFDALGLKADDADVVKLAGSTMNSTANITFVGGGEVLGLPSVPSGDGAAASKKYVDDQIIAGGGNSFARDVFVLSGTDISNGYVDLSQLAIANSELVFPAGGLPQVITDDYTLSVPGSVTRVTFQGQLAADLIAGDKLIVQYAY